MAMDTPLSDTFFSETDIAELHGLPDTASPSWGRLYGALGARLDEITSGGINIQWPSEADREEFVATMLTLYEERYRSGLLLDRYATGGENLLEYLASRFFLHKRALTFLKGRPRCLRILNASDNDDPLAHYTAADKIIAIRPPHAEAVSRAADLDRLDGALVGLHIRMAAPECPSGMEKHAAAQLYPRCDWSAADMAGLLTGLIDLLTVASPENVSIETTLRIAHQRCRTHLGEALAAKYRALEALGDNAIVSFRDIVHRMNDLMADFLFRPLDAETLRELFHISRNNADQLRKRYRSRLEELLLGNAVVDAALAPIRED